MGWRGLRSPSRKLFNSNNDGTLSVIAEKTPIISSRWAASGPGGPERTLGIDPETGRLFVVVADPLIPRRRCRRDPMAGQDGPRASGNREAALPGPGCLTETAYLYSMRLTGFLIVTVLTSMRAGSGWAAACTYEHARYASVDDPKFTVDLTPSRPAGSGAAISPSTFTARARKKTYWFYSIAGRHRT